MKNSTRSEIRFPEFTVEWNQCKLEDAADIIDENSELPNIKVGNYELLQKNDVVVADASEDYQGIATPAVVTYTPEFNLVSGLHTIALRPKKTVAIYLYYLLNTKIFKKYGYKVGTGMKVFGISSTNLMKFEARYPSLDEQEQIGNFLKQLDDTIALYQNELDVLKKTKKGFLQKMFPKEGKSVPEIRFPGFADDWEQRKLSELSNKTFGGGTPNTKIKEYWNGDIPWIQSSDLQTDSLSNVFPTKQITTEAVSKSATKLIPKNSIAIVTRVGVGKLAFMPYSYTASQDFLSLSDLNVPLWFGTYCIYNLMKREINNIQGTSIKEITKDALLSKQIKVPYEKAEQEKIGALFKQLDDTIALHQRELEALKETKKAFLQKMFINT